MEKQSRSPDFLTPRQVAIQIGVTVETVRLWLRTGQLKGTKVGGGKTGGSYLIPVQNVQTFREQKNV